MIESECSTFSGQGALRLLPSLPSSEAPSISSFENNLGSEEDSLLSSPQVGVEVLKVSKVRREDYLGLFTYGKLWSEVI